MTEIQRGIDDPITFFFWEIDEIIVIASSMFLGIMVNMLLTFGIVGLLCSYLLGKLKKTSSEGVMIHFLYWHGFINLKNCPKSYMRELTE